MTRTPPNVEQFWESEIEDMDLQIESYLNEAAVVAKATYHYNDTICKLYVEPVLSKPENQNKIIEFVGKYMDKYNKQLSARGPMIQMAFMDTDRQFFYDLFGLDDAKILEISTEAVSRYGGDISKLGTIRQGPYKVLFTGMLSYSLRNNMDDMITCMEYMLGFVEYPLLFAKYFKLGVNEDIMRYTIEHLSNSFKIKKMNNVQELLKHDVNSSVNKKREDLIVGSDLFYVEFINRVRTQLNATMRNISIAYYDNHKNNNSMHTRGSVLDDGELTDQEGHTSIIASTVDNSYNRIITGGIISHMVEISATRAGVDKSLLQNMVTQVFNSKDNRMYRMIECLITSFFVKNPTINTISTGEFLAFGLSLFRSIGTSKDPMYTEIRDIKNIWMDDIVGIRKLYEREATIINYSRGVYDYIILAINYHK